VEAVRAVRQEVRHERQIVYECCCYGQAIDPGQRAERVERAPDVGDMGRRDTSSCLGADVNADPIADC